MHEKNRSPCRPVTLALTLASASAAHPVVLRESVTTEHGMRLTERLGPDRGNAALREEKRIPQRYGGPAGGPVEPAPPRRRLARHGAESGDDDGRPRLAQ